MPTQFVIDEKGEKIAVILPIRAYEKLIEQLEDMHDIQLYDEAKQEDDGERVLFTDYLKQRKAKHG